MKEEFRLYCNVLYKTDDRQFYTLNYSWKPGFQLKNVVPQLIFELMYTRLHIYKNIEYNI